MCSSGVEGSGSSATSVLARFCSGLVFGEGWAFRTSAKLLGPRVWRSIACFLLLGLLSYKVGLGLPEGDKVC